MKDINQDIRVAYFFSIAAFITIVSFIVIGFTGEITTGLVLMRNYGIAIGAISVVFTRTANREALNHRNTVALSMAFKLGLANVGLSVVSFLIFALML